MANYEPLALEPQFILRKRIGDITVPYTQNREIAHLDMLNLAGQMATCIGHEIRNPLTSIRGYLQMVKQHPGYGDEGMVDLLIEELDRANSTITEFISLSKDKLLDRKITNINTIVGAVKLPVNTDAQVRKINVIFSLEEVLDTLLDAQEISCLLLNIARNGLDAMSPGGTLFINTYMENDEIILSIRDEGQGISPEIFDKIGNPFVTDKPNSTGLGLSICCSIASRHRAKIDIETGFNGTTVSIRFPV